VEPYELLGKAYGSMAHDLKGILSVELSLDPLLQSLAAKQTLDRSELAAVRDTILALGDRLRRAADIVKTFRLVARGAQDEEKDVNLFDSVSASVRLLADQHRQIRRQLAVANHFDSNCLVRLRPMALHQLLFNLALNAVQQTERFPPRRPFGGEIVVELGLECLPDGKWAIIRVHDTGPGIHHADLERIFEVGFSTKEDGFGMGLDICRRIGRQVSNGARHGSVTVARSIMFVGSVFEVRLPVPSSAAPRA
jgi:signal transduction histidine kinase